MQKAEVASLQSIAEAHSIAYEALKSKSETGVATRMSRVFNIPQKDLYALLADLEGHVALFPHLKKLRAITNEELGGVLGENEVIVVEGMEEGGSKLGIKRFKLTPPSKIEGTLLTDPFPSDNGGPAGDRKMGTINWYFEEVDQGSSRMTIESDFVPNTTQFYVRGLVDNVWLDFFENVMIRVGELRHENKLSTLMAR